MWVVIMFSSIQQLGIEKMINFFYISKLNLFFFVVLFVRAYNIFFLCVAETFRGGLNEKRISGIYNCLSEIFIALSF